MAQNVPSYVPTSGLVGWWPFNGNANDESGNNNNGTVNGATLSADRFGNANKAYQFNNQNITVPNFNVNNGSLSLSFWFNPNNVNTTMRLITHSWNYNNMSSFSTHIDQQQLLYGYLGGVTRDISNGQHHLWSPNTILSNQWQHYILVATGNVSRLYLNGNLLDTTITPNLKNSQNILYFGGDNSFPYFGYLDDIGIWNRALTQQEITNLYNSNICYQTITVTDTLIINMGIGSFNPVIFNNTIKIFPNPTNDHITIDYGNFASLSGYKLKIENSVGQQVFQTNINQQTNYLSVTNWGGNGLYFVKIIDPQLNTIDVRKIILR
jgi:hypothetical protein